jgi:hypothetical protein
VALAEKGATLGQLRRWREAIRVYDEVDARFGDLAEPTTSQTVATALLAKAQAFRALRQFKDELRAYDAFLARYGEQSAAGPRDSVTPDFRDDGTRTEG